MYIFFIILGILALLLLFFTERKWLRKLSVAISILSFIGLGWIGYSDRKKSDQLQIQANNLRDKLDYSYVAQLNHSGFQTGNSGAGFATEIYYRLKPLIIKDSPIQVEINCLASSSINILTDIINYDPKFPFSYLYRAQCKKHLNIEDWQPDIDKAQKILLITTKLAGHSGDHDQALKFIENQKY